MNIRGKIAQIIDETRVVLNIGARDGVQTQQPFLIFEEGEEILDPDTHESLGKLEIPKGRVIIEHVQERISLGITEQKLETEESARKTLSELMVEASTPVSSERYKLNVDPYNLKPFPAHLPVKVGDNVRSLTE
ncbi:hypothetical protein L0128_08155 [candidate division KSB1 bacterium]|nr:hypothetical protein [candidate division KSB1 bacterium]